MIFIIFHHVKDLSDPLQTLCKVYNFYFIQHLSGSIEFVSVKYLNKKMATQPEGVIAISLYGFVLIMLFRNHCFSARLLRRYSSTLRKYVQIYAMPVSFSSSFLLFFLSF